MVSNTVKVTAQEHRSTKSLAQKIVEYFPFPTPTPAIPIRLQHNNRGLQLRELQIQTLSKGDFLGKPKDNRNTKTGTLDLKRPLIKDYRQMGNKHMKRYLTSGVVRKVQSKQ